MFFFSSSFTTTQFSIHLINNVTKFSTEVTGQCPAISVADFVRNYTVVDSLPITY